MRSAIVGGFLLVLGLVAIPLGILPPGDVYELWQRVWPIMLFVIAITVVTELAAEAGVFGGVAEIAARFGCGRAWLLWLLVVAFAAVSTVFLSLDTTAVLLTPIVVVLAKHVGLNPIPFAITTVWLANTASLLLPVSNLTNLLAQQQLGSPTPAAFAALTWAPALVAVIVPVAAIFVIFRRDLLVPYELADRTPIRDRVLFTVAGVVVAALVPALVSGIAVWIPASAGAVILIVAFLVRRPRPLAFSLVPWQLVLLALGLFLFMDAAHAVGLGNVLSTVSGRGDDPASLFRLAGVSGFGANLLNNLPAFLALQPVADSHARLVALLIGVNVGSLITPWASLATLLWFQRLAVLDVRIPWRRFVGLGLIVAPVTVAASTLALCLTL